VLAALSGTSVRGVHMPFARPQLKRTRRRCFRHRAKLALVKRITKPGWVVGLVVALLLTGCGSTAPATQPPATVAAVPDGALSLLVEPDDGVEPLYALISAARRTVDLTMYELVDPAAETALAVDARRGVHVRVVLDVNREKQANQPAYDLLRSSGAQVAWAASRYAATHEKALVIDGDLAAVMTLNLTSRYYASTRDFAVLDRDPADVRAIEAIFEADFDHAKTPTPRGDDLVWSPGASEPVLAGVIGAARETLLVENEEMASAPILRALLAAVSRGVAVTVTMTDESDWEPAFDELTRAGARVSVYASNASFYIHAKVVIADAGQSGARAFVGSENFSTASLDQNRELGVVIGDPALISELTAALDADTAGGQAWSSSK
jgi:cardiolipin synthase